MEFANFLFSSKDFFHLILAIIFFCFKRGRYNSESFYRSSKANFFKRKAYILCLLFIIIGTLKFFEYILVATIITSCKYSDDKVVKQLKFWSEVKLKIKARIGFKVELKIRSKV